LLLPPFAPRALPASSLLRRLLILPRSHGKISQVRCRISPSRRPLYPVRFRMTFGFAVPASSPPAPGLTAVRVPTVESLLRASFSFTSRLRLAFRYGCRHRLRSAPFIRLDSAHAGHTGAGWQPARECTRAGSGRIISFASECHSSQRARCPTWLSSISTTSGVRSLDATARFDAQGRQVNTQFGQITATPAAHPVALRLTF